VSTCSTINIIKEHYKTETILLVLNEPYNILGNIFEYAVAKRCFRLTTYKCRILVHTTYTCMYIYIYINPGMYKFNKNLEAISKCYTPQWWRVALFHFEDTYMRCQRKNFRRPDYLAPGTGALLY